MDFATYQNLINQNKHRQDDSLSVRFYDKSIKTDKINDNGIPIFKSVCYCEIRIKDNTTEVFDQPATQDKIDRFPIEYARYQLSKQKSVNGTPLEMFAFLSTSEIDMCKYRGIFSVEDFVNISQEQAQSLQLEKEWILAQKFMSSGKSIKKIIDIEALEEKYKSQIDKLNEQIKELSKTKSRRKSK